jgi:hypothetical protein
MAYGRKTGGRQKGTPNKIRGAFARAVIADIKRRGVDLVREFNEAFEASADAETAPSPLRTRYLFQMLRFAQIAERAEAAEADAAGEAEEAAPKSAAIVTTAPPKPAQPLDKSQAFSKVDEMPERLRAALLASTALSVPGALPGLPGGPKWTPQAPR